MMKIKQTDPRFYIIDLNKDRICNPTVRTDRGHVEVLWASWRKQFVHSNGFDTYQEAAGLIPLIMEHLKEQLEEEKEHFRDYEQGLLVRGNEQRERQYMAKCIKKAEKDANSTLSVVKVVITTEIEQV